MSNDLQTNDENQSQRAISIKEIEALKWLKECLEQDTLPGLFDMGVSMRGDECGTVACAGGWVCWKLGMRTNVEVTDYLYSKQLPLALYDLYFPPQAGLVMGSIPTPMVIQAIGNVIESGKPKWHEIDGYDKAIVDAHRRVERLRHYGERADHHKHMQVFNQETLAIEDKTK